MKKYTSKAFLSSLCSLSIACSALFADQTDLRSGEILESRIEVGNRPSNFDEQKLKELYAKEEQETGFEAGTYLQSAFPYYKKTNVAACNYNSLFSAHWLNTIAAYGDSVELEDGSWWKIPQSDTYIALSWRPGDPVEITPNKGWFSSYVYYITNRNNGSSVKANLNVGPIAYGPSSHWINSVDYATGHVYLENGTCWCISNSDAYIFREWAPNDTIIIGLNDSWFSSYDHILINVNMNTYARVKLY